MKLNSLMLFWMLLLLVHDHVLQQPNGGSCFACVEEERIALLHIKSSFLDIFSWYTSWNTSIDCCSWYGVHCSPTTKHIKSMDLDAAWGYYYYNNNTLNASLFLPFRELRSLTLSHNSFNSCIPSDCFGTLQAKLDNLQYLDLAFNNFDSKALSSLEALGSLKALSLQGAIWMETEFFINGVSGALSKLSKLKYLDLSYNYLNGSIIPYLGGISSLKTLDLHWNKMNEGLDLNACQAWSNMSRLENLNLFGNSLNERIIPCLNKASSLKTLNLAYNDMAGNFSLKGLCKIKNLEKLDISHNNLKRNIPECLGHLSSLKYIDISYNQLGTLFPSTIIKNLTMLKYAFFSDNNFEGILSIDVFSNKSNLKELDLSNNYQLEIQTEHPGIVPQFQLNKLFLFNCILNKPFGFIPTFLSNQHAIEYIDLSSANLKGNIPQWLFKNNTNLEGLNLKNNSLNGSLVFPSNNTNLFVFDVSNNHVTGEIPNNIGYVIPNIGYLAMSHNLLQGVIPSSFGSLNNLNFLDLSYNTLSSVLPNCIGNLSHLRILNLAENKLEGDLTSEFCHLSNIKYSHLSKYSFSGLVPSCINMSSLEYLNLNGNHLTGPFPSALLGSSLAALDIGNNNFIGNIPEKIWTRFKNLTIVILKGNHFEGELSEEICKLKYLRILDLSQNKLHGKIPSCVHYMGSDENLNLEVSIQILFFPREAREMIPDPLGGITEIEYIKFSSKGRSDNYKVSIRNNFSGLDLSGNQFDGKIPEKIGEMTWLQALNLSNNRLTGPIPAALSKLRDIESLDLSNNMLIGSIPPQLAELNFLAVFSVAYNNLSGPTIGCVAQFGTFTESSYEGNPYLYGPLLSENCSSMVPSVEQQGKVTNDVHRDNEEATDRLILFASIALGFIGGFWGWMALLFFKRNLRYSFFLAVDGYIEEALDMVKKLLPKMKSFW